MNKTEARRRARARLRRLGETGGSGSLAGVERRLWSLPEVAAARVLLLYAALPGEVPTAGIAEEARRRGIHVTYPRCVPGARMLTLHRVEGGVDLLEPGAYGIREPHPSCALAEVEEIDAALIPALAWDRAGTRLGRGAGYYDRLLAHPRWRAARVGAYWSAQEEERLPRDEWDVALQVVVTEREIWRPPPSPGRG
jgi:5-formyltetrahydrofolate cyclo-ligase